VIGPEVGLFLVLLLAASGAFSMAEAALFSLGEVRRRRLARLKFPGYKSVEFLIRKPRRLLITIVLGNMFVNILLTSSAAAVAIMFAPTLGPWAVAFVITVLIYFFGEIIPKTVGVVKADTASAVLAPPVRLVYFLVWPLTMLTLVLSDLLTGKQKPRVIDIGPEEVMGLLAEGEENGVLDETEREMIERVVSLGSRSVSEILTPRTDIFTIPADASPKVAGLSMKAVGYSRAPVTGDGAEDIVGVVYAKDLLINGGAASDVKALVREPVFVPEAKKIIDLFYEFRETKNHFALVTDEYGDIAGLVTMDDVLAEIIGEVDVRRRSVECVTLGGGTFIVSARLDLEEFDDLVGVGFEAEGVETTGGFIINNLGRIPEAGERFVIGDVLFQVLEAKPNRIERLWVTNLKV
jgi:putative hemolysin